MAAKSPLQRLVRVIWGNWQTNELWQRILKNSIACTIALSIAVIPRVVAVYGLNTYLLPMTTIFAHPGQRMGKMIESLTMILAGSLLGLGWSLFGLHMSDLVIDYNPPAASSIRAVFLLTCILFHGFVRSKSPRLFVFVWFFLIGSVTILLGRALEVTLGAFTAIQYPILSGTAVVLVINLSIFPEHSTSYLGSSTINTMHEAIDTLTRATHWFVTPGGDSPEAKQSEEESSSKKTNKSRKKTWWDDFASDFPNPFQTKGSSKKAKESKPVHLTTLATLAEKKSSLRALALACKSAQNEVNFELAISPLEPRSLKPISKHGMSSLVQNTITLIGACENKFVLLKNSTLLREEEEELGVHSAVPPALPQEDLQAPVAPSILKGVPEEDEGGKEPEDYQQKIEDVKPMREIGTGSAELLESLLKRIRGPTQSFEAALKDASTLLLTSLAYCYDVPKLPSGALVPRGIELQELDIRIDSFTEALHRFDAQTAEELKNAASDEAGDEDVDLMPRMEMFLVSSFLLGFRQAATQVLTMLRHARTLVEQRKKRHDRSTIWLPHHADIWQWLSTSGEADGMVLPESARKEVRTGRAKKRTPDTDSSDSSTSEEPLLWIKKRKNKEKDEEAAAPEEMRAERRPGEKGGDSTESSPSRSRDSEKRSDWLLRVRGATADALEWAQHSDDLQYALKLAIAVFIVSWPSFVPSWRAWYGEVRGIWAPLQLVLVFEVSIGCSLFIFMIRLVGVIFGCAMGLLSYQVGNGNRIAMVVVLVFGIVPSVYIQVGTKYVKAGMISTTTMCVVALAAMNQSGTAVENFYKRLVAFLVGSCVGLLVEIFILPVRARDRLVESLSSAVRQVQEMQSALSVGVDSCQKPNFRSHKLHHRFSHARDKAQGALAAAETFLPFCLNEPRLKGSFKPLEPIYKEIIYVLHQIIDRMDNVVDLRKAYGSSVLEDLHFQVFAYRRSVAASNTLMLFSVHEALTTWLPLPQFLPSSRLAQARLVNRVREIVASKAPSSSQKSSADYETSGVSSHAVVNIITEKKFLSWNASTAGYMELIEYLEELVELTKLLVGVNAFRSGLLERPQYKDYVQQARTAEVGLQRLASRRSARSSHHAAEADKGAARFRRAAAMVSSVQKFRQAAETQRVMHHDEAIVSETAVVDEEEEADDGIPMSLRRVGTRLQREYTVSKRRRYTSGSRG